MTEGELRTLLNDLNTGAQMLTAKIDALEKVVEANQERFESLEKIFFDEIVTPAREAIDGQMRLDNIEEFRGRHGEKLEPFNEQLKAIEGDDFDLVATTYDEYSGMDPQPEEMEFVDAMVETVAGQIEQIKEKFGLVGDVTAEIEEDGTTTITDEKGSVVVENADGEIVEESTESVEIVNDEEMGEPTESELSEIEEYEKELEEYL